MSGDRVTFRQAAELLDCHASNIAKLIAKGHLARHRDPGRTRGYLLRTDVDALAEARLQAATAARPRVRRRPLVDHRPDGDHDWLSPREVAKLTGVTPQAVAQRIRRGHMPAVRNGGRVWIRRDHLEQFEAARLASRTRRP